MPLRLRRVKIGPRKQKQPRKGCMRCIAVNIKSGTQCKNFTCQVGPYCKIHLRSIMCLEVKPSKYLAWSSPVPLGLFAAASFRCTPDLANGSTLVFKKGDFIADYNGDILDAAAVANSNSDYILQLDSNTFIDSAQKISTPARFANDCRGLYAGIVNDEGDRNKQVSTKGKVVCNAKMAINRTKKTARLLANTNIYAGDEILWSYGNNFWSGERKKLLMNHKGAEAKRRYEEMAEAWRARKGTKLPMGTYIDGNL